MQFELFEKLSSSNKFQIELEKSYDYLLMIYMKKKKNLSGFVWMLSAVG